MEDKFKAHNMPLIEAIHYLMNQPSMESERAVYLSLTQAVFLMPAMIDDEDKMKVLDGRVVSVEPGCALRVAQFTSDDGEKNLYPAFTSMEELERWDVDLEKENIYLLEMDMESFMTMLSENQDVAGFVIDPFTVNLVIEQPQLTRYVDILQEEMERETLINPMSRLLDELREQPTPETENRIYQALQNFRFLMPIFVDNKDDVASVTEEGVADLKENVPMHVVPLENEDGERVFPVFTDLYEVRRSGIDLSNEHNYLVEMTMEGMEDLVQSSDEILGFAINPFTHNVIISELQFERYHEMTGDGGYVYDASTHIDNPEEQEALEREQEVLSTIDNEMFTIEEGVERADLEQALSKEMDSLGNIHKAYLLRKVYQDKERFLVVVDKERDGKSVFGDLRDAAFPVLDFEDQIEFISYNEQEAKEYVKDVPPFYERSQKRGLFGMFKKKK